MSFGCNMEDTDSKHAIDINAKINNPAIDKFLSLICDRIFCHKLTEKFVTIISFLLLIYDELVINL